MKKIYLFLAIVMLLVPAVVRADVTGDFKLGSAAYFGDDSGGTVSISGTVNRGAIQSKKTVVTDITYDIVYSYSCEETEIIVTPGPCTDPAYYNYVNPKSGKYEHKTACDNANHEHSALWKGTTSTFTITKTFNEETGGMIAQTSIEYVNVKGRLNPSLKITGYDWKATSAIDPVALSPIPDGCIRLDAAVASITYRAYLVDASGAVIPDTVVSGTLY